MVLESNGYGVNNNALGARRRTDRSIRTPRRMLPEVPLPNGQNKRHWHLVGEGERGERGELL